MEYREFKIGDIVKCIKICDGNTSCLNKLGKIIDIFNQHKYHTVEFFEPIAYGHNGKVEWGKEKNCWDFDKEHLKLYIPILKLFLKEKQNESSI